MKTYKIHIKPRIIEAENEENALEILYETIDKLEFSCFEEITLLD